jgi:hypothetical protein
VLEHASLVAGPRDDRVADERLAARVDLVRRQPTGQAPVGEAGQARVRVEAVGPQARGDQGVLRLRSLQDESVVLRPAALCAQLDVVVDATPSRAGSVSGVQVDHQAEPDRVEPLLVARDLVAGVVEVVRRVLEGHGDAVETGVPGEPHQHPGLARTGWDLHDPAVLLAAESGAGRELSAQPLHELVLPRVRGHATSVP